MALTKLKIKTLLFLLFFAGQNLIMCQNFDEETDYITNTFFCTRLANTHTIETLDKGVLDVRLGHRMGRIQSGIENLFGLNQASSQFGVEYGITPVLMIGLNTNSLNNVYSGFVKYKILRQSTGKKEIPFSISLLSNIEIKTGALNYPNNQFYFSSRLNYTQQCIIARKFSDKFSFQISPVLVHKNMVKTREDHNNIFILNLGSRYKIKRKIATTIEYNYLLPNQIYSDINGMKPLNSISIGLDLFTGKHTFQFFITNVVAMNESALFTENTEQIFQKGLHFGFNISRLFNIVNYYE